METNSQHPDARALAPWLFTVGGALLVMGYLAGVLVTHRSDQRASGASTRQAPGQDLGPSAAQPDAARPAEGLAAPPDSVAPPAPEKLTAKEARDREVTRMMASGPDKRGLTVDAVRVGESWSRAAKREGVELKFDRWTCYHAGCVIDVRHAPDVLDRLTRAISTDPGFVGWHGEKFRSGPLEQADGKVEVTWILYAPPEGEPALVVAQAPEPPESPASQ